MQPQPLYRRLASAIEARKNCEASGNMEWFAKHSETIRLLVKNELPSGSGWDNGTRIELPACHANKIVLYGGFHHMNENGCYDGWTEHTITVLPDLANSFTLRISGRDRNDVKEYLYELFDSALRQEA